jgi:hypothetical protein
LLTADLVNARRRDGKLHVAALTGKSRARAVELAGTYLAILAAHVDATRDEVEAALAAIPTGASERKLGLGLRKLLDDACTWEAEPEVDPAELRAEVFHRAAAVRRALGDDEHFDRAVVLEEIGRARGLDVETLERALFADLRGAYRLLGAPEKTPEQVVEAYEDGQAQAVLLRAVRVTVQVDCATASEARALFRRLKFLRLLYRVQPRAQAEGEAHGYAIEIDGPFAMFEASTKYGLQLALLLPVLRECRAFALEADLRWGKEREALKFETSGGWGAAKGSIGAGVERTPEELLPDEVAQLLTRFRALDSRWRVEIATELLDLPGVGLCAPDLVFIESDGKAGESKAKAKSKSRKAPARRVFLEVLGYWSRDAVWKRVELVRAGLPFRVLFAVGARLRVSEEVLDEDLPGALYVYKGAMSARAVLERLEKLETAAGAQ